MYNLAIESNIIPVASQAPSPFWGLVAKKNIATSLEYGVEISNIQKQHALTLSLLPPIWRMLCDSGW